GRGQRNSRMLCVHSWLVPFRTTSPEGHPDGRPPRSDRKAHRAGQRAPFDADGLNSPPMPLRRVALVALVGIISTACSSASPTPSTNPTANPGAGTTSPSASASAAATPASPTQAPTPTPPPVGGIYAATVSGT